MTSVKSSTSSRSRAASTERAPSVTARASASAAPRPAVVENTVQRNAADATTQARARSSVAAGQTSAVAAVAGRVSTPAAAALNSGPVQSLLSANPSLRTHQDLISHFHAAGGNTWSGAQAAAGGMGLDLNVLARDRAAVLPRTAGASITDGGDGGRSAADASREARAILEAGGAVGGPASTGGEIVQNPLDPTDGHGHVESKAQAMVEKNAAQEAAALQKLTPAQQEQYARVKQATVDAGDAMATLSVQTMLIEQKLPGEPSLAGKPPADLLTQLDTLATQPLAKDLGGRNAQLVASVAREVAVPTGISQGAPGTCGPTALFQQVSAQHPAEYARIISGLASPAGTVQLAGGWPMKREPGTFSEGALVRDQRSISQFLVAPAAMEYANGPFEGYDPTTDRNRRLLGEYAGLLPSGMENLAEDLFGRPMDSSTYRDLLSKPGDVGRAALDAYGEGNMPVAVLLPGPVVNNDNGTVNRAMHWVTVSGTGNGPDGKPYVELTDPWGHVSRLPREDFEAMARALVAPR